MRVTTHLLALTLGCSACGRLDLGGYYVHSLDPNQGVAGARAGDRGRGASAGQAPSPDGGAPDGESGASGGDSVGAGGAAGNDESFGAAGAAGDESFGAAGSAGTAGGRFESCRNLDDKCGLAQRNCCAVGSVAAGEFIVGGLAQSKTGALRSHVSSFQLGLFEVTVGRFQAFLNAYDAWRASGAPQAGAGRHPLIPGSGWDPAWLRQPDDPPERDGLGVTSAEIKAQVSNCVDTPLVTKLPLQPVNCVSFYDAAAFCIWDGGRLPTDLEWEYAAAGGDENRIFPWGSPEPVPARAAYGCHGVWPDFPCQIPAVGSFPEGAGRFGQLDLAGSVEEWTFDTFTSSPRPIPCNDCASIKQEYESNPRVMHGGNWTSTPEKLLVAANYVIAARFPLPMFGFRCAYDAP